MNILHIISAPASGGAEVYVKDLAKQHSSQGYNVHVAFLNKATDIGRSASFEREFLSELKSAGINTYIIGIECRKKPWLGALRVKKYIKENDIDICHAHLTYGILFSSLARIPLIYTHHNIKSRLNKLGYMFINTQVDKYIGISKLCSESLKLSTDREVVTINNAVSKVKFKGFIRQRSLPSSSVTIAMVGHLGEQKDYLTMLNALALLDNSLRKKIKILIAGEGSQEYKDFLLKRIKELSLCDTVELEGIKNNIVEFLYQADLFMMTSAWEGLPISLIEATISGLPCIVTDVGGCSEVISNCSNGIIVPPHDPASIAMAISKLVTNNELITEFSKNAISNSYQYSIEKSSKLHTQLYSSYLN